jgi:hypothetical protein
VLWWLTWLVSSCRSEISVNECIQHDLVRGGGRGEEGLIVFTDAVVVLLLTVRRALLRVPGTCNQGLESRIGS